MPPSPKRKSKTPTAGKARPAKAARAPRTEAAEPTPDADLAPVVGANLRRLRNERGMSLEQLAKLSKVSRAMLGQVELGQSAPTINVMWKICRALNLPFATLLATPRGGGTRVIRAAEAKRFGTRDERFVSRGLFPTSDPPRAEFYELRLLANASELADAHPAGTQENLVVSQGKIEIELPKGRHALGPGDAILFEADVPHVYRNVGDEDAVMYLVMTYG